MSPGPVPHSCGQAVSSLVKSRKTDETSLSERPRVFLAEFRESSAELPRCLGEVCRHDVIRGPDGSRLTVPGVVKAKHLAGIAPASSSSGKRSAPRGGDRDVGSSGPSLIGVSKGCHQTCGLDRPASSP